MKIKAILQRILKQIVI